MKKFIVLWVVVFSFSLYGVEVKKISEVVQEDLIKQTQVSINSNDSKRLSLVWWIPSEYWKVVFANDPNVNVDGANRVLKIFENYSIVAVVQADMTPMGIFDFYSKEEVEKNLRIVHVNEKNLSQQISIEDNVEPELKMILGMFKPILAASMGNLGENMHFFVLKDKQNFERVLNPYKAGNIKVEVASRQGQITQAQIALPVDALFVPRICPNGKQAHISWNYCPWGGEKLEK
jgi:hypothetical protein